MFRFHPGVNRLYTPSEEVAKRAFLDGLEESQIRVFGLPIRPSFCRAIVCKVNGWHCFFIASFFECKFDVVRAMNVNFT